jgi:hypothetical protein
MAFPKSERLTVSLVTFRRLDEHTRVKGFICVVLRGILDKHLSFHKSRMLRAGTREDVLIVYRIKVLEIEKLCSRPADKPALRVAW